MGPGEGPMGHVGGGESVPERAGRFGGLGRVGVVLAVLIGTAGGLGTYTFLYAQGASYLSNDANACANCHIMQSNLDAWAKSSHRAVASCNDCHAPHGSLLGKLWVKGKNGFNHSLAFTTGRFPEPIRITDANLAVTEATCRSCHESIVQAIDTAPRGDPAMSCIRCHRDVGHLH